MLQIVHHDDRTFDANDARVMEQFATQIVLSLEPSDHSTRPLALGVN